MYYRQLMDASRQSKPGKLPCLDDGGDVVHNCDGHKQT